jgi:hypothetical protein
MAWMDTIDVSTLAGTILYCTAPASKGGAMAGPTHPSSGRISTGRQELF